MRTFKFVPRVRYFVIVFIAVLFFSACKKDVVKPLFGEPQELTTELNQTAKDFFDLNYLINNHGGLAPPSYSRRAPSEVVDLVYNDLIDQELENNFVVDLVEEFGYPAWQNADIIDSTAYAAVYIPFSFIDSEEITAYLSAAINGEDVYYRLVSRGLMDSVIQVSNLDHNRGIVVASLFSFTKVNRLAFGTNTKRHLNFIEENVSFNENGFATKIQGISTFGQPRNTTVSWTVCEKGEYVRRYWVKYVHHAYTIICSGDSGGGGGSRWGNPWKYTNTVFKPNSGNHGGGNGGGTSTQNQPLTNLQNLLKDCEEGTLSFDPLCTQYNLTIGCLPFLEARQDVLNWYHSEGLFSQLQSFACSAANKRFLESAIVKYYQLKSSNQINVSLEAFSENWYPVWELKEWGINIDQTKELWLLENLDELDAIHEFIHLNGSDAEHSSAAEIYMNLASQELLDIEYGRLDDFDNDLSESIGSTLDFNQLNDRNLISSSTWYQIFHLEAMNNGGNPPDWIQAILSGVKDAWEIILYPGKLALEQIFVTMDALNMPSTIEEWQALMSVYGPTLIKLGVDIGTDFIPIVGEIKAFYRAGRAFTQSKYGEAALEFFGGIAGIIPIGDLIRGGGKVITAGIAAFAAFKAIKALSKVSASIFIKIKNLVSQGWSAVWDNGLKKIVFKNGDEIVGEIDELGVPIIKKTIFKTIVDPSTFKNLRPKTLTNGGSNYIEKEFIKNNANKFNVVDQQLGTRFDDIVANGDPTGRKTEELLRDILDEGGNGPYRHFDGTYNGPVQGRNGFDGVFVRGPLDNPTEIIINESKQFTQSGITLSGPGSGIGAQMTDMWVTQVSDRLRQQGKEELAEAILMAQSNGTLTKIVTVVDRTPAGNPAGLLGGINILRVN